MVVLLIIAILLAVAIPTYLAARNRAENRAAQVTLQHVLVSAKAAYASQNDFNTYPGGHTTLSGYLNADGPGSKVVSGTTVFSTVGVVGVESGAQKILMGDWAPDGKCFYLLDIESPASLAIAQLSLLGPGTYYKEGSSSGGCSAYHNSTAEAWQTSWAAAATHY